MLLAVGIAAWGGPVQSREIATSRSQATIDQPIAMDDSEDMNFGRILALAGAGTVVLSPRAAAQCTTTGSLVHSGACQAAAIRGDAPAFFLLRVTGPATGAITLQGPAGATMRLDNFKFGPGSAMLDLGLQGSQHRFLLLTADGSFTVYAGGTLHVASQQQPGIYRGTFEVSLNYN